MAKQNFMVGFYKVSGIPGIVQVECPLQLTAQANYRLLLEQVRTQFPQCHESLIRREGSRVIQRDSEAPQYLDDSPGKTLRNLFPEDSPNEAACEVGSVFWEGEPWEISLRYFRHKAAVGVALVNRMNGSACPFTAQFPANQLVTELPRLIGSILPNHNDLKLRLKPTVQSPKERAEPVKPLATPKTQTKPKSR